MAKFKVGDKVEIRPKKSYIINDGGYAGKEGTVCDTDYSARKWVQVQFSKFLQLWFVSKEIKHV